MLPTSPTLFRVAIFLTLVGLVLALLLPTLGMVSFGPEVEAARGWNYFDSLLPGSGVIVWYAMWGLVALAGLIGSMFFWGPARWLLAVSVVLSLVAQPFLGLVVYSPFEATFAAASSLLMIWISTVSFWSPLASRFTSRDNRQVN